MANTFGHNSGTSNAPTAVMPDDIAVGDFVWFWINITSASITLNNNGGCTLIQTGSAAVDFTPFLLYKIWGDGDTAPVFGLSASDTWTVDCMRNPGYTYDKSAQTSPVNNVAVTNSITPNAGVNNARCFFFASVDATGGARTWTNNNGTEIIDRVDGTIHRQVVQIDIVGAPVATSVTHTVTGSAQDQLGFSLVLIPPVSAGNVKHKYKSGGVFTARPIKHKSGGVFTYRPIKTKTSGTFS